MPGVKNNTVKNKVVFAALWLAAIALLTWKANKGFGNIDESLYLAIPYRFFQGDGIISGEWNLSMLSSWFMYPLFWLYMQFAGSTEGIILSFRYIYTGVQAIVALFLFRRFRYRSGAALAAIFWMMYTPFNIMALSYNTMGIIGITVFTTLLVSVREKSWWAPVLGGIALSGAVLGCPYLVAVYLYYACLVLWNERGRQGKPSYGFLFEKKGFLYVTGTCAAMAGMLLVSVFRKTKLHIVLKSIPLILSLPDHGGGLVQKVLSYISSVYKVNLPAAPVLIAIACIYVACLVDKHRKSRRQLYFFLLCLLSCIYAGIILCQYPYVNYMVVPIVILGFGCFLMTEKRDYKLLIGMFIPAVIYSFAVHLASNQQYYAICSGISVAIVPSVFFVFTFMQERDCKYCSRVGILTIVILLSGLTWTRIHYTFWDQSPSKLTVAIDEGPNKGVLTTQDMAEDYGALQEKTEQIRNEENGRVLYFTEKTWLYLEDDKRNAGFSPWLFNGDVEYGLEKLKVYYQLHPEAIPDWIYVDLEMGVSAEELADSLSLEGTIIHNETHAIISVKK